MLVMGALLLFAAMPMPVAADHFTMTPAPITGHAPWAAELADIDHWDGQCTELEDLAIGDRINPTHYELTADYATVVVISGRGPSAITTYGDARAGQSVWADTDPDGQFFPGGPTGDHRIDSVILCGDSSLPTTDTATGGRGGAPLAWVVLAGLLALGGALLRLADDRQGSGGAARGRAIEGAARRPGSS